MYKTHTQMTPEQTQTLQELLTAFWQRMPESARDAYTLDALSHTLLDLSQFASGASGASGTNPLTIGDIQGFLKPFMHRMRILKDLRGRTYAPQRSIEWLNLRKNLLTASNLADALNKGKFSSRNQLVKKKAEERCNVKPAASGGAVAADNSQSFFKCFPMKWGTMFEPMIARIYTEMHQDVELYEFGLVIHPTLKCFGASPDGITSMGKMVEIKCPWKRPIVKGEVPSHYHLQIQGQLAVCGLDECDYFEVVMEDLESASVYLSTIQEHRRHAHGILIELQGGLEKEERYVYSPPKLSPKEAYDWAHQTILGLGKTDPDVNVNRMRFWNMKDYNLVGVPFEPDLWTSLVPEIERFWGDVVRQTELLEQMATTPTETNEGTAGTETIPVVKKKSRKKEKIVETFRYRDDEDDLIF